MKSKKLTLGQRLKASNGGIDDRAEVQSLFRSLKASQPELEEALHRYSSEFGYADHVYRFYHQSFKVFAVQSETIAIVEQLRKLALNRALNPW